MKAIDADIRLTDKQKARVKLTKYAESQSGTYQRAYRRYKALAKRADQRLVALERASETAEYANVTKWAYANAMYDIRKWSGEGKTRFNTAAPKTTQGLLAKIKDIESFLLAPTSKKSSIKEIYDKRRETIEDKFGLQLNWSEVATIFDSSVWRKFSEKLASKSAAKQIGYIQDAIKKFGDDWRDHVKIAKPGSDKMVNGLISEHGIALELMLD